MDKKKQIKHIHKAVKEGKMEKIHCHNKMYTHKYENMRKKSKKRLKIQTEALS